MPSQRTLTLLFSVHSWVGIITGLLLFIVCLSGGLVVFKHEIDYWANPSLHARAPGAPAVGPDAVLAAVRSAYPKGRAEQIVLPDGSSPAYYVFVREKEGSMRTKVAVDARTGEVKGQVDSQLGQFIRMLHVFLFFGPRWIVGFLGVLMLVLALTGFVIHRKILRELFTLRWGRSPRLAMSDTHKATAIWGLPFHVLIAFTGAWLGLAPLFIGSYEYFAGIQDPLKSLPTDKTKAPLVSVDTLLQRAREDLPGFSPEVITLRNAGRADAVVILTGDLPDALISTARLTYSGSDGHRIERFDPRERGFWSRFNGWMEPLHFGHFGGITLKALYALLGVSAAGLSVSGTLIWADRRRQMKRSTHEAPANESGVAHV
ncbi:PepSY-associated TM helix domain-containing protein [Methyloversatilis thermotolerans]|uniref:PepSY-associated TM helix domain-containing protein n=1 Tax=Methyloversatilis thermotolerans TaxID=1346290 RepID=UPI00036189FC|nr:PepSY-associated TM helix domain-containing protein [Methyloversatilis thermotolerans]